MTNTQNRQSEARPRRGALFGGNMKEKIFFTDLDGTLLDDNKKITPGNREAIERSLKCGHKMVIATGRPLASALVQAERLDLMREGCYIIAFNGAQIYDCFRKETIFGKRMPLELVDPIFQRAHELGLHVQTYTDTEVIAEEERPELKDYSQKMLVNYRIVQKASEALPGDPYKILVVRGGEPGAAEQLQREVLQKYGDILDSFFSNDMYMEIVSAGISKGNAVRWMCENLNIPIENSVSAGDGPNDIDMIEAAYVGAAMSNSFPGVKEHADYVTSADNNHDGAAEIINKFILADT